MKTITKIIGILFVCGAIAITSLGIFTIFTDLPRTVIWGDDYLKKYPSAGYTFEGGKVKHLQFIVIKGKNGPSYELGLRSDGVVVWREAK